MVTHIEIPTELLETANLTADDVKAELAVYLLKNKKISTEDAKSLAGTSKRLNDWLDKKGWAGHIDMDEFISWAAHDLKSPINAITGFTRVVIKGIDGPVTDLQVTDLSAAFNAGQRMLTLLNNLIDMARLNHGDIKIEITDGDLVPVLGDAINRWKTQNPAKELQTEIGFTTATMKLDNSRMRQVLTGLLTYAANHVAEGGKVSLKAQEDSQGYVIQIESHGEKARDKFEMDLAMLGYICHGLIELHGGTLQLGEDTGSGFSLNVNLPKN